MESSTGKESIVSRLFAFGRRKPDPQPDPEPSETGFARTEDPGDEEGEGSEQVVRIRGVPGEGQAELAQSTQTGEEHLFL